MFILNERNYRLVRVGLVRAACPREIEHTRDNLNPAKLIRIDANTEGLGRVPAVGFVPAGIITAGAMRRRRLLEAGIVHDYAFVESIVTDIKCGDEISSNELLEKLNTAIREKILGPQRTGSASDCCMPGQMSPYIQEVYPFESYFIYNLKGDKYRQMYILDPVTRTVRLAVGSQKVEEVFVNAVAAMPRSQTGIRPTNTATMGNSQTVSPGAPNSDLVVLMVRNWKNILEAVNMYLSAIRNGQHKPPMSVPSFAPVNLTPAGKMGQQLSAKGIDVYDFAKWSAAQFNAAAKTKEGLPASSYAYVGDKGDISTWHLKVHDAAHVRDALARVNQTHGIPMEHKAGVLTKLRKLAVKHGIGVSSKPTGKQKQWVKK